MYHYEENASCLLVLTVFLVRVHLFYTFSGFNRIQKCKKSVPLRGKCFLFTRFGCFPRKGTLFLHIFFTISVRAQIFLHIFFTISVWAQILVHIFFTHLLQNNCFVNLQRFPGEHFTSLWHWVWHMFGFVHRPEMSSRKRSL